MAKKATAAAKKTPAANKAALDAAAPPPETAPAAASTPASDPAPATQSNDAPIFVFDELLDTCRFVAKGFVDQSAKESDRDFMLRVFTTISDMPEDGSFEKMQAKTQNWYNEAAAAESEGKSWEMPEGFTSKFGKAGASAAKPAAKAKETAPAKAPKAPPAPKEPKAEGVTAKVRRIILKHPTTKLADIQKLVADTIPGTKTTTVATLYSDCWATLKIAQEVGWLAPKAA